MRVAVHVVRDQAELYLDLAGESLHQRGYRSEAREAPIKETLAAAMLRLAGWDRKRPLVDPMCGSGTIAIEALLWARAHRAGARSVARYGFQRWALARRQQEGRADRDPRVRAKARVLPEHEAPSVMALDIDGAAR